MGAINRAFITAVLCFTMVVTAVDVLTKYWPFGANTLFLCRFVKSSPCFAVYLASLTIVVIALDRYRCIVRSDLSQLTNAQVSVTTMAHPHFNNARTSTCCSLSRRCLSCL